jgi:hypothetical protein
MMGRYHLTTICTDSSRPNTPKHAKIFSACGGQNSRNFSGIDFHQLPTARQNTTWVRPWCQAARAARRPCVEMQYHAPEPPYRPSSGSSAVCRMQRRAALGRATRSANARRPKPRSSAGRPDALPPVGSARGWVGAEKTHLLHQIYRHESNGTNELKLAARSQCNRLYDSQLKLN